MKSSTSRIMKMTLLAVFFSGAQLIAQEPVMELGDKITYQQAENWMQNYDLQQDLEIRGHLYGENALHELLDQDGVQGLKIYNGIDNGGTLKIVLKGLGSDATETGLAFDVSKACPPHCGGGVTIEVEEIGAEIAQAEAQQMINNFAAAYPLSPSSYSFSATMVKEILNQERALGIYMAYGVDNQAQPQLILMALDARGDLIKQGLVAANPKVGYNPLLSAQK